MAHSDERARHGCNHRSRHALPVIAPLKGQLHLFQQQIRDDLLELLILGPQLLHFAWAADNRRAELFSPSIEGRLCYPELAADLRRARSFIDFTQRLHDLLSGEPAWPSHPASIRATHD